MSSTPPDNSVESYVEALSGARSTAEIGAKLEIVIKGMGFDQAST